MRNISLKQKGLAVLSNIGKNTAALAMLLVSSQSIAAEQIAQITKLVTYATYANNDTRYHNQVNIEVVDPISECNGGYYLAPEDTVANPSLVSFLLSAFHAGSSVRFAADENQVTPGSKKFCRIINISIIK